MNLYASIPLRKSCRKYDMQPLKPEVFDEIEDAIKSFEPLYPDSKLKWRFTNQAKGRFYVKAPHYLIISGEGKNGEMENTGFLFEQLVLWFDTREIGCVWLGETKDAGPAASKNDIIAIGFGYPTEPVHRTYDEFKRKSIGKITNTPDDLCIQAVHLAPSGMNTQPWYFEKQESGETWVYKQKLKPPISLMYKHSDIDMGIGLCHYALACKEIGKPFKFSRSEELHEKSGYLPFGIIK